MKTECPKCNGMATTSLSATDGQVFHNQEFVFLCNNCRHTFSGVLSLTRGVPAHAQAFGAALGQARDASDLDIY